MLKIENVMAFENLPDSKMENDFRVSWTKNADVISVLYSGTPAMKTDFTLLGKRTLKGNVMDLFYGIKRWFLGNFYDSYTQDMIDVSVGKLKPKRDKVKKSWINVMFVVLLLVSHELYRSLPPPSWYRMQLTFTWAHRYRLFKIFT